MAGGTATRRGFLLALAAGTVAALDGCTARPDYGAALGHVKPLPPTGSHAHGPAHTPANVTHAVPSSTVASSTPPSGPPSAGPTVVLDALPGNASRVALTVDDGYDSAVVSAYLDFARASGVRLTFFPNGCYRSWTDNRAKLLPLLESGQVQLGNHTWSHADLTRSTDRDVLDQIGRNDRFIADTFGVRAAPYLRPPYGHYDRRVEALAAELGYRAITMWYGTLGDSAAITQAQLMADAREWLRAGRIVIGHANHPTVTHLYGQLLDLLHERRLQTVTLHDVFGTDPARGT